MKPSETIVFLVAACVAGGGCKHRWSSRPHNPPRLERKAQRAAKESAKIEIECFDLTAATRSSGDSGDAKWFAIEVAGCGRTLAFEVTCAHGVCTAEK